MKATHEGTIADNEGTKPTDERIIRGFEGRIVAHEEIKPVNEETKADLKGTISDNEGTIAALEEGRPALIKTGVALEEIKAYTLQWVRGNRKVLRRNRCPSGSRKTRMKST